MMKSPKWLIFWSGSEVVRSSGVNQQVPESIIHVPESMCEVSRSGVDWSSEMRRFSSAPFRDAKASRVRDFSVLEKVRSQEMFWSQKVFQNEIVRMRGFHTKRVSNQEGRL